MKLLPQTDVEKGGAVLRVLAICLVIFVAACFFCEYLRFARASDYFGWISAQYGRHIIAEFEGITMGLSSLAALLMLCASLVLIFGDRRYRDVRYGCAGICVAILSCAMWWYPSKAKARGDNLSRSTTTIRYSAPASPMQYKCSLPLSSNSFP